MTTTTTAKENKFESVLTKIGKAFLDVVNVGSNLAEAEQPLLDQLLPEAISSPIDTVNTLFRNTMASVEAKYQAIGSSDVTFAQKVAEVVAISGAAAAQILTQAGYTVTTETLSEIATGATNVYNLLGTSITTSPTAIPSSSIAAVPGTLSGAPAA
jgi:hypothetical protein